MVTGISNYKYILYLVDGATSRPSVRWNDTNVRRDREEEFMSKYERVTGAKDDCTVFKSNLPGKCIHQLVEVYQCVWGCSQIQVTNDIQEHKYGTRASIS